MRGAITSSGRAVVAGLPLGLAWIEFPTGTGAPSRSIGLPRSSTARAGRALIVNRVTICGLSYPSTCRVSIATSPTRALSAWAATPTSPCSRSRSFPSSTATSYSLTLFTFGRRPARWSSLGRSRLAANCRPISSALASTASRCVSFSLASRSTSRLSWRSSLAISCSSFFIDGIGCWGSPAASRGVSAVGAAPLPPTDHADCSPTLS
jgi:hypothetical protein